MFVTTEKEREWFLIFFLYSFCQLLSPRFYTRAGWVRPDHESSDQPAQKPALSNVVSLFSSCTSPACLPKNKWKIKIVFAKVKKSCRKRHSFWQNLKKSRPNVFQFQIRRSVFLNNRKIDPIQIWWAVFFFNRNVRSGCLPQVFLFSALVWRARYCVISNYSKVKRLH